MRGSFTTESPVLRKTGTAYKLARQFGVKYFPESPLDGTYAILDMATARVEGEMIIPLTLSNAI